MNRREAMGALLVGGLTTTLADVVTRKEAYAQGAQPESALTATVAPAYRGINQVKPLPFEAGKLKGLSEKLINSHHQNNYTGAVKRLNQIQQQIGSLPKDAAPYQMGSLKREELIATNSMILHEFYFGNLGGDGKASGTVADLLKAQYGTLEAWEQDFRLTGLSLGGGSGWVILNYNPREKAVLNYWASDHTQGLAGGMPLLVMDMYEHSYQMDYGANARGYVDAFFQNINWDEVNRRTEDRQPRTEHRGAAGTAGTARKWVTRHTIRLNRVATAWLIRRFIDPQAVFLFVNAEDVATVQQREGAKGFDAPGATYPHQDAQGRCSFEALVEEYCSKDLVLRQLARIVHEADLSEGATLAPEPAGLRAISHGFPLAAKDDYEIVEKAAFLYDALYAALAQQQAGKA